MNKVKSIRTLISKTFFLLKPSHKKLSILLFIASLIGAVLEMIGISLILPLVSAMLTPETLWNNKYLKPIIDALGIETDGQLLMLMGCSIAALYVVKNLYLILLCWIRVKFSNKVQRELSLEMMTSYMDRGYPFFLKTNTSKVMRGMTTDVSSIYNAVMHITNLILEILTAICIVIYILFTDLTLALTVLGLSITCMVVVLLCFRPLVMRAAQVSYEYSNKVNKLVLQAFQGIKEVMVMHRQKYFVDTYEENYVKQQGINMSNALAGAAPAHIIEGICVGGLMMVVTFRIVYSEDAVMLIPKLAGFAMAAFRILPAMGRMSNMFNVMMRDLPGVEDAYENFTEARNRQASMRYLSGEDEAQVEFTEKVELKDIVWAYEDADEPVIKNLNMTIKKGQSVGFVGPSGAGKTTLADIILGLLQPEGSVTVDGVDVYSIPDRWAHIIGFVPQNVYLLDDTIRNNVAFGVKESEIDDEKVWRALEQAQLKDMIIGERQGLDTLIGERGVRFSGGQRQRIAIARALYNDPAILVLDEATSALDNDTETAVMESIDALQGQKTMIIIAHRLTTVRNCDVIYEIAGGVATERSYESLGVK